MSERVAPLGPVLRRPLALALATTLGSYALAWLGVGLMSGGLPESALELWDRSDAAYAPPLFAWLCRGLAAGVGDLHLAGLLVSGASYAAALVLLHRLICFDQATPVAGRTMLYLAVFPTAWWLHTASADALFLALVLGSFYAARCGRWPAAGALGGLAGFTHVAALGLIPALGVEHRLQNSWRGRRLDRDWLWLGLVPLGIALHALVTWLELGDPLAVLERIREPGLQSQSPGAIGPGLAALALALVGVLRLRASYSVFWLAVWLCFAFGSGWIPGPRQLVALFPAFLLLALWGRRAWFHWTLLALSGSAYLVLMLLYVQGRWSV